MTMGACGAGQRTAEAGQTTGVKPAARECAQAGPPADAVDAVASRLDIRTLQAELARIFWTGSERNVARAELVSFVAKLTNAVAVAIFDADTFGELTVGPMRLAPSHAGLEGPIGGRLRQLAHAARRSARVEVERRGDLTVVAAPIAVHGKAIGVLATGLVIADESLSSFVVILQLIAGHVALWETNQDSRSLEQEAAATAALLELVSELSRCETAREAATTAANAVREQVGCDCVAIGLARNPKQPSRLVAVSSVAHVDSQAEVGRLIESVIEEARVTRVPLEWFAENQSDSATLTVGALSARLSATEIRGAAWTTGDGESTGGWVAIGTSRRPLTRAGRWYLAAAEAPLARAVNCVHRGEVGRLVRAARVIRRRVPLNMRRVFLLALGTIAAAAFVPVPYKIDCVCTLEPVVRRFVAAPHAGVFEKSIVELGDRVRRNDVLGRMDGREIRWELAGVTAETRRVAKGRDVNLAAGKVAAAQMDALELERLAQRERLLQHRLANLEIKSPINGAVIGGDLKRSEGVPLSVGQPLYEIGPIERMVAQIDVPQAELSRVTAGQNVEIELEAYPGEAWNASIERIHPRSETREGASVFVAEAVIENAEMLIRPGMRGRARVTTSRQPIGWIVFHAPWRDFLHWSGW